MAIGYLGIEGDYDTAKEFYSKKLNHQPIQVEYSNMSTGKKYFWEYMYNNRYTRYTVCESLDAGQISTEEIDLSFIENMFEEGEDLFEAFSDNSEQMTLSSVWEEDKKSTGFEDISDDFDPNDPLNDVTDNNEVSVNYINDKDIQDNIECVKTGDYKYDYVIKDYGKVIYDEYIYTPKETSGYSMVKKIVGNPNTIYDMDELFNNLTRFSATKGVKQVGIEMTSIRNTVSTVVKYENAEGHKLEEVKNSRGEVLMQKYFNPKENISIVARYYYNGMFCEREKVFGRVEFPVDYSEYHLILRNNKDSKRKGSFKYKTNRKCLYIPKIDFFKKFMNLGYIEKSNYEIVDTPNKLIDIVDNLQSRFPNKDRVIGYDAETQGLEFRRWVKQPHQMVTHSLSWEDHQSIIVPVRMKYCQNINPIEAAQILRPILEKFPILAHNGAADVRFNWCRDREERIDLNLQEDTMHLIKHIMPFACHKEVIGYGRAIDDLIAQTFKDPVTGKAIDMIDLHKYVFKTSDVNFDFALLNEVYMIYYGCPDTDLMRMLWKVLRPKLSNKDQLYAYKNTVLFSKNVAINSTYGGLGVNINAIQKEKHNAQVVLNKLEEVMYTLTGETKETLSFTSAPQKCNYIFGKMGAPLEYARRTSEGKLSADKTVVKNLASLTLDQPVETFKQDILDEAGDVVVTMDELNRLKFPFCRLLRIHGDLTKNITAFYNGILNNSVEGVYYPDFRIGVTDTWRTTDRIQITKKNIKHYLGPVEMDKGKDNPWGWFSVDYAAEEFRLTVNGSDDNALKEMLTDPESDPHTMVASELYGIPPYKVSGDLRKKTKSCNFGIIYGMRAKALAQKIFNTDTPTPEQIQQAQELYELYCYKRALMLKPLEEAKVHARDTGWLINQLGYKMVYHQIIDVKDFQRKTYSRLMSDMKVPEVVIDQEQKSKRLGALLNACGNFPIQSWAGAILMSVYNKLNYRIKELGFEDDIVIPLQVHDEIGGYFRKDKVHPYLLLKLFNDCMVSKLEYLKKEKIAPLYIGVGFGTDWGDAKDDNAELPVALQMIMIEEWNNNTCPTIEEINEEGIYNHFNRRIAEYMKSRLRDIYKDMIDNKHFIRQEMQHRLNNNMFVGKKIDELFHTNDKKTKEIIIEKYIELILGISSDEALNQGYTWEEGEPIEDESERELTEDEIQDFFFLPQTHPRLTVEESTIIVDLKNIYTPIANTAIKYIKSLCNPEENIHNKSIIIKTKDKNIFLEEKILGMPVNFSEKFDEILKGKNIQIRYDNNLKCPIVDVEDTCIEYKYENKKMKVILDINKLNNINSKLFKGIATILEKQTSRSPIANIEIWLNGVNLVDTGLRLISIDDNVRNFINSLIELSTLMNKPDSDGDVNKFSKSKGITTEWVNYLKAGVVKNE